MELKNVTGSAAAELLGMPAETWNLIMPKLLNTDLGTSAKFRDLLGVADATKNEQLAGQLLSMLLPIGGAPAATAKATTSVRTSKAAQEAGQSQEALFNQKLTAVQDWIHKNSQTSGYNELPMQIMQSPKNPEYGVLVNRQPYYMGDLPVGIDIRSGMNRPHAADASLRANIPGTSVSSLDIAGEIRAGSDAHALPVDSRLSTLLYQLQEGGSSYKGTDKQLVEALKQALDIGVLDRGAKKIKK